MSAMARRHHSEQRRLLGLRRAVHYTLAGTSLTIRTPAVIKAGTMPKASA